MSNPTAQPTSNSPATPPGWTSPICSVRSDDDPNQTALIIDLNPYTTGMSAMPPFLMNRVPSRRDLPDQHRHRRGRASRRARSRSCSPTSRTATDGNRPLRDRREARNRNRPARRSSPARRSGSMPPRSPSKRACTSCSSECAATRSSPTRTGPSTASSGPGRSLRGPERPVHRDEGAQRHAQRRAGDRSVGLGRRAAGQCDRPGRPWWSPDDQPVRQSQQRQERIQPARAGGRRRELSRTLVEVPRGQRRVLAGRSAGGSPGRAAGRPSLRPLPSRRPTRTDAPWRIPPSTRASPG